MASATLQDIAQNEANVSTRGGVMSLPSGSKEIPIMIGTPKTRTKDPKFSHQDLVKIQISEN